MSLQMTNYNYLIFIKILKQGYAKTKNFIYKTLFTEKKPNC